MNDDLETQGPSALGRSAVGAHGARGVLAGDFGIQVNVFNGTWLDEMAPAPLADESGKVDSPYRGLSPFEQWDGGFFFGRDEAATSVLRRIDTSGLLMVSGVSGAGKSSLLRAGVLPRIRNGELTAPGSASWPRLVLTPTASPLDELAERVAPIARADAAAIRPRLGEEPASFARTARQATRAQASGVRDDSNRLVLIVDQFEQLFTRCTDEDQRRAFVTALHAAAGGDGDADPTAVVVLVVRADFEARCAEYTELTAAVQNRFLLTAMTERQLRLAITEPAKRAGSTVEGDLVETLLQEMLARAPERSTTAHKGLGAGALPLLSHALDQAWRGRVGQMLTLADYERTGGIEGAVAASAHRAYASLTPRQQTVARRVFVRLVATGSGGEDTATRVARADLTVGVDTLDVDKVLHTFADARLLTLAASTVEISHEVLLTAWPLLRDDWLEETHSDRVVRARLHVAAREWTQNQRNSSYLYQGSLLENATATANRIRTDPRHPPLSRTETDFLRASTRARRRRVRVRRVVTAVLAGLALAAATLSVAAADRGNRLAGQLRTVNAETLGQESQSRAPTDIATAAQLALAAWRSDPRSPQARTALGSAYLAMATLDAEVADVTTAPIKLSLVRGDTALLVTEGSLVVVTAITGPTPRRWQIPGLLPDLIWDLSPDGRWLAYLARDGTLRMRDILSRSEPKTVAIGQKPRGPLAFSPDGKRLGWLADSGRPGVADLLTCDLTDCTSGPPRPVPLAVSDAISGLWLTPDPNRVLIRYGSPGFDASRLVLRSATDGSELATMAPGSVVARDGATIVSCEPRQGTGIDATPTIVVTNLDGAAPTQFSAVESTCDLTDQSSARAGWWAEQIVAGSRPFSLLRLTNLENGEKRQVTVPSQPIPPIPSSDNLGVSTASGQPSVLFAHGTSLLRLRTEPDPRVQDERPFLRAAEGNRYLSVFLGGPEKRGGTVRVDDRVTGRRIVTVTGPPDPKGLSLNDDSLWLFYSVDNRERVDRYSLSPPGTVATFALPAPDQGGTGSEAIIVREGRSSMLLAVSAGVLSALDPLTGRLLSPPVTLGPPEKFATGDGGVALTSRPGHLGQVALVGRDVEIWDALSGRSVSTIRTRARGKHSVAFDPSGQRIAMLTRDKTIELWDVGSGTRLRPPIPASDGIALVGFDADGYLDLLAGPLGERRVAFIDVTHGREVGSIRSSSNLDEVSIVGDPTARVPGYGEELPYELPLTARAWHDALCAVANRPFTERERGLLPEGADDSPPCS